MQSGTFEVKFKGVHEIRMSSPYNSVELCEVRGAINLDFKDGLQDLYAQDSKESILYLVSWGSLRNNEPDFFVIKIDPSQDRLCRSKTIPGCCSKIEITPDGVRVTASQVPVRGQPGIFVQYDVAAFPAEYTNYTRR